MVGHGRVIMGKDDADMEQRAQRVINRALNMDNWTHAIRPEYLDAVIIAKLTIVPVSHTRLIYPMPRIFKATTVDETTCKLIVIMCHPLAACKVDLVSCRRWCNDHWLYDKHKDADGCQYAQNSSDI